MFSGLIGGEAMGGIELKGDIIDFKSEFHINVIEGSINRLSDSATYKTFLFSSLSSAYENRQISSNCELFFDLTMRGVSSHLLTSNSCLILDEANYEPRELDKLLQLVRQTGCYLIMIGRMYIKQLEYSVDAMWHVVYDGKRFRLEQLLKPNANDKTYSTVACEDSTSVAAIYTECLLRETIPVFGRSNFFKVVKKNYNNCLLIADRAKFGPELLNLVLKIRDKLVLNEIELDLYLPQCFEEICLELVDEVPKVLDPQFFDYEEFFENQLSDILNDWNKSNLTRSILQLRSHYDFNKSRIILDLKDIVDGTSNSKFNMFYKVKFSISRNTAQVYQDDSTIECTIF